MRMTAPGGAMPWALGLTHRRTDREAGRDRCADRAGDRARAEQKASLGICQHRGVFPVVAKQFSHAYFLL
jgi:hypothetical protein